MTFKSAITKGVGRRAKSTMSAAISGTTDLSAKTRQMSTKSAPASPAAASPLNYTVVPKKDFGTFKEYSVIHTDRSLNLMSDPFCRVMRDLNQLLKHTYNADKVVIIPGYV